MAYLLDSDIVIDYLGGDLPTRQLVDPLRPTGYYISAISYTEVLHGILMDPDPAAMRQVFTSFLVDAPVIPYATPVAERCARLRFDLQQRGRNVRRRAMDLLVAATALEYGLTLVTRNKADYHDIPGLTLH